MAEAPQTGFLQHIFSDIRTRAGQPLLCEKQGEVFKLVSLKDTTNRIDAIARAFAAAGVISGDRIAFYAGASPQLLITEWAVLATQAISVIVPRGFAPEDMDATLVESKSKIVIVDRLATAYHLADRAAILSDLKLIICLEGSAQAQLPVMSLPEFIDSGRMEPDRSAAALRAIALKDTALMFYYKDATGLQATRYSHGQLMDHAARTGTLLGKSALLKDDLVVTATVWEHPVGHIASCYAPILKEAVIQLTHGIADTVLFENQPQAVVGDAVFFNDLRAHILQTARHDSLLESYMLTKALALSKQYYVSPRSVGPLSQLVFLLLKKTVIRKVKRVLGGRLRILIGTDDEADYETQMFFHAFGVELIELPPEMFA